MLLNTVARSGDTGDGIDALPLFGVYDSPTQQDMSGRIRGTRIDKLIERCIGEMVFYGVLQGIATTHGPNTEVQIRCSNECQLIEAVTNFVSVRR